MIKRLYRLWKHDHAHRILYNAWVHVTYSEDDDLKASILIWGKVLEMSEARKSL